MLKEKLTAKNASVCFFCALLFVLFAQFLLPDKSFSETEKRVLSQRPPFRIETLFSGKLESELETYIQDQMPFRNFWVGLCSYFNALTGQNGTDGIYAAKDGYLIQTPNADNPRNLRTNLKRLNAFAQQTETPAYLLIVPQTGYILPDKLPRGHAAYNDDALFSQIKAQTADSYTFVDLRQTFADAREKTQIYYKTDHHWTSEGAFLAANAFLREAGKTPLTKDMFEIEPVSGFYGTTYSRAALWGRKPDTMELWKIRGASLSTVVTDLGSDEKTECDDVFFREHLKEYDRYPVYLDGNHSLTHIVNDAVPDGTLLLLKDSFGNTLATQLAAAYHEIWMIDLRYYRTQAVSQLLTQYGADAVLVNYSVEDIVNDTNFVWLK